MLRMNFIRGGLGWLASQELRNSLGKLSWPEITQHRNSNLFKHKGIVTMTIPLLESSMTKEPQL
ncbi:conserved protein of unknown function [Petrocella atlantisensis]|uniref:Uncharacterized protein n=1 Tax=Petrocella atlantisensis TaxID=2173034 RepID=A0A3P7P1V9_9FIRM|nr:MAG: hypothetical protein CVV00_11945 [Firmicutes bacterium HGW-Firmicutes-5]VDN49364.1 conserved protein of unknown function [Petrocella atlantisensis]